MDKYDEKKATEELKTLFESLFVKDMRDIVKQTGDMIDIKKVDFTDTINDHFSEQAKDVVSNIEITCRLIEDIQIQQNSCSHLIEGYKSDFESIQKDVVAKTDILRKETTKIVDAGSVLRSYGEEIKTTLESFNNKVQLLDEENKKHRSNMQTAIDSINGQITILSEHGIKIVKIDADIDSAVKIIKKQIELHGNSVNSAQEQVKELDESAKSLSASVDSLKTDLKSVLEGTHMAIEKADKTTGSLISDMKYLINDTKKLIYASISVSVITLIISIVSLFN